MNSSDNIKWKVTGNVGIITISNPPQNYLIKPDFIDKKNLLEWASMDNINGLIIRGEGRHFSAGANLDTLFEMSSDKEFLSDRIHAAKELLKTIENLEIPVIAAIRGICFGGGLEIALACHIRICAENSVFAFPEINHNLIPGIDGAKRLSEITGKSTALELLMSGDTINAEKALEIGLINHITPSKNIEDFSLDIMNKMVDGKIKKVVNYIMRSWHNSQKMNYDDALAAETKLFCELANDELIRRKNDKLK